MNCPLCNSQSEFVFEIKGFDILDCGSCKHRYAKVKADEKHVVQTYGDSYFNEGDGGYADYLQNSELLYERGKLYAKKVQKITNKKGRVLDVGAAAGFILKGYLDNGWSGMGIEPNLQMTKYGQKEYGLDIQQGSFESFKADDKFDLISMIQVVAHFYDQRKAFENASELLNDNGLLLIESWDKSSLSAKIFGKNWHEYAPPSVLHWYSVESLTNFLKTFDFEKVAHGRPLKKISGRHIKSVLKYRYGKNFFLKMIPDKIILPYPSEDLFWALYRKKAL